MVSIDPILRRRQVEAAAGLRTTQLYDLIAEGRFPKQVSLGKRSVGWLTSEVSAWIAARKAERDAA